MDYPNLHDEMIKGNISVERLAEAIHESAETVSNRFAGNGEFTIGDAFLIQEKFFPHLSIRYLFSRTQEDPPIYGYTNNEQENWGA